MPFQSKAQMRMMFAKHPKMAKRWAEHTPDIKSLPEYAEVGDGIETASLFDMFKKPETKYVSNTEFKQGVANKAFEQKSGYGKVTNIPGTSLGKGLVAAELVLPTAGVLGAVGAYAHNKVEHVKISDRGITVQPKNGQLGHNWKVK